MSQISQSSFLTYKATFLHAIRQVLADAPLRSLDEAGFPAYAHPNPLINWLFWQRLRVAINDIVQEIPYERTLDFGCGSGILLPYLAEHSQYVLGLDIDLQPYERIQKYISFPSHIEVFDCREHPLPDYPPNSFDLITALDVLEHVTNLSTIFNQLMALLKPGGRLIISGPTENVFYKFGRLLTGKEFTGAYHERGIAEIAEFAHQVGKVKMLAVLYPLWPLFQIFSVEKLRGDS
ncbi:MAG: class I SAM-dependent methyltransferase [Leptolinea sp.]